MIVLRGHPFEWEVAGPGAVTIGVFDGVHLGHRRVIGDLIAGAADCSPIAVTFDPHPLRVVAPERAPQMLTDVDQRVEQFRLLGVEIAAILHFPDIRFLPAEDFVGRVLCDALQAKKVVVGADFRFGHDRVGDTDYLIRAGERLGFTVEVVDMFGTLDGVVSSTRIRQALTRGQGGGGNTDADPALRAKWNRDRGGPAGEDDRLSHRQPRSRSRSVGARERGVCRFGDDTRDPNFRQWSTSVSAPPSTGSNLESRLTSLDWEGDLYQSPLALRFVARLRGEERFESVEALVDQIGKDAMEAREVLAG